MKSLLKNIGKSLKFGSSEPDEQQIKQTFDNMVQNGVTDEQFSIFFVSQIKKQQISEMTEQETIDKVCQSNLMLQSYYYTAQIQDQPQTAKNYSILNFIKLLLAFKQIKLLVQEMKPLYQQTSYYYNEQLTEMADKIEIKHEVPLNVLPIQNLYKEFISQPFSLSTKAVSFMMTLVPCFSQLMVKNQMQAYLQEIVQQIKSLTPGEQCGMFPISFTKEQIECLQNYKLQEMIDERPYFGETQKIINILRFSALHPQILKFMLGFDLGFFGQKSLYQLNLSKIEAASLFFQIKETDVTQQNFHLQGQVVHSNNLLFFQNLLEKDKILFLTLYQNAILQYQQKYSYKYMYIVTLCTMCYFKLQESQKLNENFDDLQMYIELLFQQKLQLTTEEKIQQDIVQAATKAFYSHQPQVNSLYVLKEFIVSSVWCFYKVNIDFSESLILQNESKQLYNEQLKQFQQEFQKFTEEYSIVNLYELQLSNTQKVDQVVQIVNTFNQTQKMTNSQFQQVIKSVSNLFQNDLVYVKSLILSSLDLTLLLVQSDSLEVFFQKLLLQNKFNQFIEVCKQKRGDLILQYSFASDSSLFQFIHNCPHLESGIIISDWTSLKEYKTVDKLSELICSAIKTSDVQLLINTIAEVLTHKSQESDNIKLLTAMQSTFNNPKLKLIVDIALEELKVYQNNELLIKQFASKLEQFDLPMALFLELKVGTGLQFVQEKYARDSCLQQQTFINQMMMLDYPKFKNSDFRLQAGYHNELSEIMERITPNINNHANIEFIQFFANIFKTNFIELLCQFELFTQNVTSFYFDDRQDVLAIGLSKKQIQYAIDSAKSITQNQNRIASQSSIGINLTIMEFVKTPLNLLVVFACYCGFLTTSNMIFKQMIQKQFSINDQISYQILNTLIKHKDAQMPSHLTDFIKIQVKVDDLLIDLYQNKQQEIVRYMRCLIYNELNNITSKENIYKQFSLVCLLQYFAKTFPSSALMNLSLRDESIMNIHSHLRETCHSQDDFIFQFVLLGIQKKFLDQLIANPIYKRYCRHLQLALQTGLPETLNSDSFSIQIERLYVCFHMLYSFKAELAFFETTSQLLSDLCIFCKTVNMQELRKEFEEKYFHIEVRKYATEYKLEQQQQTYTCIQSLHRQFTLINEAQILSEEDLDMLCVSIQILQQSGTGEMFWNILEKLKRNEFMQNLFENSNQFERIDDKITFFNKLLFVYSVFDAFIDYLINQNNELKDYYDPGSLALDIDELEKLKNIVNFRKIKKAEGCYKLHSTISYTLQLITDIQDKKEINTEQVEIKQNDHHDKDSIVQESPIMIQYEQQSNGLQNVVVEQIIDIQQETQKFEEIVEKHIESIHDEHIDIQSELQIVKVQEQQQEFTQQEQDNKQKDDIQMLNEVLNQLNQNQFVEQENQLTESKNEDNVKNEQQNIDEKQQQNSFDNVSNKKEKREQKQDLVQSLEQVTIPQPEHQKNQKEEEHVTIQQVQQAQQIAKETEDHDNEQKNPIFKEESSNSEEDVQEVKLANMSALQTLTVQQKNNINLQRAVTLQEIIKQPQIIEMSPKPLKPKQINAHQMVSTLALQQEFVNNNISTKEIVMNCASNLSQLHILQDVRQDKFTLSSEQTIEALQIEKQLEKSWNVAQKQKMIPLQNQSGTSVTILSDQFGHRGKYLCKDKCNPVLVNPIEYIVNASHICSHCNKENIQKNEISDEWGATPPQFCLIENKVQCYQADKGIFKNAFVTDCGIKQFYLTSSGIRIFQASLFYPFYNQYDLNKIPGIQIIMQGKMLLQQFQDILLSCVSLKHLCSASQYFDGDITITEQQFSGTQIISMQQQFTKDLFHLYEQMDDAILQNKKIKFNITKSNNIQQQLIFLSVQNCLQMSQNQDLNFFSVRLLQALKFMLIHIEKCDQCKQMLSMCQQCQQPTKIECSAIGVYKAFAKKQNVRKCDKCQ